MDFFGHIEAGDIDVSCTSKTAETVPSDNQDAATNVVALPDPITKPPPVDLKGHLRYVF